MKACGLLIVDSLPFLKIIQPLLTLALLCSYTHIYEGQLTGSTLNDLFLFVLKFETIVYTRKLGVFISTASPASLHAFHRIVNRFYSC